MRFGLVAVGLCIAVTTVTLRFRREMRCLVHPVRLLMIIDCHKPAVVPVSGTAR